MSPRLLTEKDAAAYMAIPVTDFRRLGVGRVPLGTRVRYDRLALDAHVDRVSGLAPNSTIPTQTDDNSPDAAFDRFLGRKSDAPGRS